MKTRTIKTTPATARLLIALDVATQITINPKFRIQHGIELDGALAEILGNQPVGTSAQTVLAANIDKAYCQVCAKGAVTIAHVLRFNQLKTENLTLRAIKTRDQVPEFPARMMDEIEALFEGKVFGQLSSDYFTQAELQKIREWRATNLDVAEENRFETCSYASTMPPGEKLTKIMALCIANNGTHFLLTPKGGKRDRRGRFVK